MKVQIKKLKDNVKIPEYAYDGDAGMDLIATDLRVQNGFLEYGTGLSVAIPEEHVGLLFPRSSISKMDIVLCNSVGVIDSGYRGEIKCRFKPTKKGNFKRYTPGDRIAQLMIIPYPCIEFEEVKELEDSVRDVGGFGSSGN